mmetsp:Transcript_5452/g.10419  ORF Transcript_5452/g.10419 Transcript_5452/m.10419 type:complete len:267 (-) Transcript_5452:1310-2110(-)
MLRSVPVNCTASWAASSPPLAGRAAEEGLLVAERGRPEAEVGRATVARSSSRAHRLLSILMRAGTAPSSMRTRWLAGSVLAFLSVPAAYTSASVDSASRGCASPPCPSPRARSRAARARSLRKAASLRASLLSLNRALKAFLKGPASCATWRVTVHALMSSAGWPQSITLNTWCSTASRGVTAVMLPAAAQLSHLAPSRRSEAAATSERRRSRASATSAVCRWSGAWDLANAAREWAMPSMVSSTSAHHASCASSCTKKLPARTSS